MSEHIQTSAEAGVLSIKITRPDKKNAINDPMYAAMVEAFARAQASPEIRAILITGVPGAFSAGADIEDFMAVASGRGGVRQVGGFLKALAEIEKPLVAAVDGLAIGIGTTLLMHCDLVYASPESIFRTPFLDLGILPEAGSSLIAPRLMGTQRAFALLALGETFDAEKAREANLVYEIAPSGEVVAKARAAAERLAKKPPEALRIARELMRGSREDIRERIKVETELFAERLQSDEARAAFSAFLQRRK